MLCVQCERPVVLIKPGKTRQVYSIPKDHDLCRRCWKSLRDKARAAENKKIKNG
jgi:hypothetical protein